MPLNESKKVPFHYYSCLKCNYSKSSRTKAESRLTVKLHERVCKGNGRTEELPHYKKDKQFFKTNPNGAIQVTNKKITAESIDIDLDKHVHQMLKSYGKTFIQSIESCN